MILRLSPPIAASLNGARSARFNSVRVRQKGPCVTIEFDGDGFLYKMVRLMVGALVKCALGKMRIEEITCATEVAEFGSRPFCRARRRIISRPRALLTRFESERTTTHGVRQVATCNASHREEKQAGSGWGPPVCERLSADAFSPSANSSRRFQQSPCCFALHRPVAQLPVRAV